MPKKPSFEDKIVEIDQEIAKRRNKWNLNALSWIDFDDISQILRIHIYKKWHLYDHKKPLPPWLNRTISNQLKNLIRNNYSSFARPCLRCAAAEPDNLCKIYSTQCSDCPIYKNWERNKKDAYNIKIPVPLDGHVQEVSSRKFDVGDIEDSIKKINVRMKQVLKPIEWKVYRMLYIENKTENEVASEMGYKTSEKNRSPGYKQITNIKRAIILKVKKSIQKDEIDIF
tara:strand:+ start:2805 stop:3485 length:681 start_codon:yes stop_codon:yes gene_type:complete